MRRITTVGTVVFALAMLVAATAAQPTVTLTADATCYDPNETVTVTLQLSGATTNIVGGQFRLQWDSSKLGFVSIGPGLAPFTKEVYNPGPSGNTVDYAVGTADGGGGAISGTMVTLTFTALAETCSAANLVTFRTGVTPPNKLVDANDASYVQGVNLTLVNLAAIGIDGTGPVLTGVPGDVTIECGGTVPPIPQSKAWGMFANSGGLSEAVRPFGTALAVGDTFSVDMDNGYINSGGTAGFGLQNASGQNRVEVYYVGGNSAYTVHDSAGPISSGLSFSDEGLHIDFTLTGTDTYTITVRRLFNGQSFTRSGTLSNSGAITRFRGFNANAGPGATNNLYFNYLSISTGANDNASNLPYASWDNGDNGGAGFGTWSLSSSGSAGRFVASSTQNGDGDGNSDTDIDKPRAWDACSGTVVPAYSENTTLDCGNSLTTVRAWTATDACGNQTTGTQTITVVDTTDPTLNTPASNMTVECDGAGNTAALAAWLANHAGATATDSCGSVTWTHNFTNLSDLCGETGAATVTFTATDDCGNDVTTTATFTIADTANPIITTPAANATVECDGAGNATDLNNWLASNGGAAATDACSGTVTWTNDFAGLSNLCGATGAATVIFTATDDCGRTATTTATFTIVDATDPTIDTAATGMTVECDGSGNAAELTAWLANHGGASASDTCGGVTWSHDFNTLSDDCGATGSATVTFTATDDCGRTAMTAATFAIIDTTDPVISTAASDATVECDGAGNATELNAWLSDHGGAIATDACGGVTWTHDHAGLSDDCGATGLATVTFTATDGCGHAATTTATFTIVDTAGPVISAAAVNTTVECDGTGNATELTAWLDGHGNAVATDACSGVTWTHDFAALSDDCGATGAATVTFTATDDCGHASTTTATFTIVDTTDPVISTGASDVTVECEPAKVNTLATWLDGAGGAVVNDACGTVTWTNDFSGLSDGCGGTGSATVTFTATDECGHTATTSATYTIVDTTAPTITNAASDTTVECDGAGNATELNAWLASFGGAAAADNCGTVTWSNDFTALSDLCGATGAATVTFTATDECGLSSTTTATFTIVDTSDPTITTAASNESVECDGAGNTTALADWLAAHGGAVAADVCSGVTWTDDYAGLSDDCGATGSVAVTFTATDDCGRQASTSATFTIVDTTDPLFTTAAQDTTVECDGSGNGAELSAWLGTNGNAVASDTCGTVIWTNDYAGLSDLCGATGAVTVTFTATDECGNDATSAATFTIVDTVNPTISVAASDLTVECDGAGNNGDLATWLAANGGADAFDNCSAVTWSNDFGGLADDCGATGSATVTFTATDDCGRTSTTTATFTIVDTTPPTITTLAADSTVECDGVGNTAALNAWLASNAGAAASDVCSGVTWTNDFAGLSDGCGATGATTVTFTATDECGQPATTTATFTIVDTTPPTVGTPAPIDACYDTLTEAEDAAKAAALAASSDACSTILTASTSGLRATCDIVIQVTVSDECGNPASPVPFNTRVDGDPPIVTAPADITVPADAGLCTAVVDPGTATAEDNCTFTLTVTGTRSDSQPLNAPYPAGITTITWTTTDECGHVGSDVQTIEVAAYNNMYVDVELQDVSTGSFTRCITFELFDNACGAPTVLHEEILFANGLATGVPLSVACNANGGWTCITARDELHTLRRTGTLQTLGVDYATDFTASGAGALIGGDLDADDLIDIVDFGLYANRWNVGYGSGNTTCSTVGPHVDINGNGVADTGDFTFIRNYFWFVSEANCCGLLLSCGDCQPRTELAVAELDALGLAELANVDLNRDGWIDVDDVALFIQGVRPAAGEPVHPVDETEDGQPTGLNRPAVNGTVE